MRIENVIFIAIFVSVLLLLGSCIMFESERMGELDDYCKEKGFDGHTFTREKTFSPSIDVCYKEVLHESGVGTVTIYSGEIE